MKTKLSLNTILIGVIVVIVIVNVIILTLFLVSRSRSSTASKPASASDVFASPVTTFNGIVEEKGEGTLSVRYRGLPSHARGGDVNVVFTVRVTDETVIRKALEIIPYTFKPQSGAPYSEETVLLQDVGIGDIVTVVSREDLQSLKGTEVTASSLRISERGTVTGIVTAASGSSLSVRGNDPVTLKPKVYTVTLSSDTEIVRLPQPPGTEIVRAQSRDLQNGQSVSVYGTDTLSDGAGAAALVQIIPNAADIRVSDIATSSARPPGAAAMPGPVSTGSASTVSPTARPTSQP
jgi:hypothetical protein